MATVTPYLSSADATAAIAFYREVFAAEEIQRWEAPDGRIAHAELRVGGTTLFLADEYAEYRALAPVTSGGCSCAFVVEVGDVDAVVARALELGARMERPIVDTDHGTRAGWIVDPDGHRWNVGTPVREVSQDELADRVGDRYRVTAGPAADQRPPGATGAR